MSIVKFISPHQEINLETKPDFKISFGISTGYTNANHLIKCVNSIRKQSKHLNEYEILIIGPEIPKIVSHEIKGPDIKFIEFDETKRSLWITRKKNLLAQQANFDRLCLMHDYLYFASDWAKNFKKFEQKHSWNILAFPQQRLNGERFWYDWSGFKGPRSLDQREFYKYTDWSHNNEVYISGNIFCVDRFLLLNHPFNENLTHMQEEDLEWSRRITPHVHFKCAYNCFVHHQKEHRDEPFFANLDQILKK